MKGWFGCVVFVELKMDTGAHHCFFSHELENCMVCACSVSWEGLDVVTGARPGLAQPWEEARCTHDSLNQNTAQEVLGTKATGESAHARGGRTGHVGKASSRPRT